ncbi:hypothetical protein EPUS_05183 [Endocarpon pusillum Z07020]|uniref:Uncharacterized protein n=1 Tax=Endocarpon pusillum (strain Z07020 / HMAS-L-300199) TaxID=1263415 RepID=U1HW55_ENDPU|nr:uncharacterized protein EPUS_05183 [Endocarpon pusillum Z07020]ERF74975.1 hypothetical protein EPUS_05183 [Endocarpon pusillum Z07020]
MEDILECILGYRTLSASKARKLHHLSQTPPEYWTAKERMLSGKARTRWLREERKRASRGGSPAILDRIWPTGPYWPNGGVLVGGDKRRKEFREAVGRMRYRDQARAEAHAQIYNVHPLDIYGLPRSHLQALLSEGDWTRFEPNQILNDRCRARKDRNKHFFRHIGRAEPRFDDSELLRNGRFGEMAGAETEEDRYRKFGWDRLWDVPVYGPGKENWDADSRPRVWEVGNGLGRRRGERSRWERGPE